MMGRVKGIVPWWCHAMITLQVVIIVEQGLLFWPTIWISNTCFGINIKSFISLWQNKNFLHDKLIFLPNISKKYVPSCACGCLNVLPCACGCLMCSSPYRWDLHQGGTGDPGGAGLVPRPAGDHPDPSLRLRHGFLQSEYTFLVFFYPSPRHLFFAVFFSFISHITRFPFTFSLYKAILMFVSTSSPCVLSLTHFSLLVEFHVWASTRFALSSYKLFSPSRHSTHVFTRYLYLTVFSSGTVFVIIVLVVHVTIRKAAFFSVVLKGARSFFSFFSFLLSPTCIWSTLPKW